MNNRDAGNAGRDDQYKGKKSTGASRRTYPSQGPRVGRVDPNVPKAQRVDESYQRRTGGYAGKPMPGPVPEDERDPKKRHERAARNMHVEAELPENMLCGRNPIREAIRAGRPVEKLLVAQGDLSGSAREIVAMAREAGIVVQMVDRQRLDGIYPAHQGLIAYVAAAEYSTVEEILSYAESKGEAPFLILLDGITDPHNLGAIVRTAECAGAHGVIIPERRAAGLTPAAAKAAAGALDTMRIARVTNLNRTIDDLKEKGIWIVGTALNGESAFQADLSGAIALVIGSEGDGISRLTLEKCDFCVTLPMKGQIESLNASVAAGILMYEIARTRP